MKVLLADPDRDFLVSFKNLMELSGDDIVTAFDGTQVIVQTAEHSFDLVILGRNIPRISYRELLKMMNENNTPVILLLESKINSDILLDDVLANAHISFPFFPSELTDLMHEVLDKTKTENKIRFEDMEINGKNFLLCGKLRITNEEINTADALIKGSEINAKRSEPYINSLNNKFQKLGLKARIRYVMKEGYRMVSEYE